MYALVTFSLGKVPPLYIDSKGRGRGEEKVREESIFAVLGISPSFLACPFHATVTVPTTPC
jgi:hypothetical protein